MADAKNSELKFLIPIGLLLLFPVMRIYGGEYARGSPFDALESAFLIPVIPLLIFPIILILGHVYNKEDWWKERFKEGGMIAIGGLAIALSLTIWLAIQFFTEGTGDGDALRWSLFNWISFDVLGQTADGTWVTMQQETALGVGIWVDSVSLMLLLHIWGIALLQSHVDVQQGSEFFSLKSTQPRLSRKYFVCVIMFLR